MTPQIIGGLAALCALLGAALCIPKPRQSAVTVSQEQRRRRLATQERWQREQWFPSDHLYTVIEVAD